jgi:hypothetical protein
MTLAFPDRIESQAISKDWSAVALKQKRIIECSISQRMKYTYQAPTGIFTGPLDDIKSKLIQPAVVFMNLSEVE